MRTFKPYTLTCQACGGTWRIEDKAHEVGQLMRQRRDLCHKCGIVAARERGRQRGIAYAKSHNARYGGKWPDEETS